MMTQTGSWYVDWLLPHERGGLFAGWNAAVRAFKENTDVEFADVNLSEEKVREAADGTSFSAGVGGWPTIRYFNKETGIGGAPYKKKTDKAMCDELKTNEYMNAYVEEVSELDDGLRQSSRDSMHRPLVHHFATCTPRSPATSSRLRISTSGR